ncbi:centromere-associated protein E isoform X2 [Perca fluviatilis]|uniref:centromere-associated protein E isoform X2 n=1 Tax=Perca fluviatilis TaxID=8168 RepID=UPI0019637389|nr:centromere-associated protein E isoform X2 [Perca fluviatilis]
MTEESAVKVCVRVRPLIEREEKAATENAEPVQLFWKTDKKSIYQNDNGNSTKSFGFDRVFTSDETTNQLYQEIAKPLVVSSVEGYNGTIFAYGQTSSGKTFTMMGSSRNPGVIPLAVEDVFQTITKFPNKEFLLRVSYMEIYNETVSDLLVDSSKRKPLEVRETINKNIFVSDLTEELVTSSAQALAWIRKGEKNRHYEKTSMNQRSSRSHAIFRMILESREKSDPASGENAEGAILVSNLNLVDLAGSERASQTGAEGARFKEGCNINRSLFVLGQVIKKLTDESQKGFTNYRDSKLTRILQNSLGGNAKTVIICTITPATLDETLSTLQFASTAKKMKNDPHVTEVSDDGALLKRYRNEIVDLKRRLHEVSSGTQTTATEKKVLSQMLQEKDQLQREQEDRIRNLTKLLVTSSNLVPVQKMPKRRVTWGGKMLRLGRPSACDGGSSDLSFAESFYRKRKADRSCLTEIGEDDDDFQWEIPDEPSYDMDISPNSVCVRRSDERSYNSPKDFVSPDRMRELSGKVSALELQLELESQQKEEALTKVESLHGRLAELELRLQTEGQQKPEALEKMQTTEQNVAELELQLQLQTEALENIQTSDQRVAELELQLQTEALQKQDALEKMQTSDQRVAELELQLQLQTEVLENMQTSDQRLAELELQLQTEAQQKLEAMEKVEMLDLRVADLERQLEDQSHTLSKTDQQMKDFAETIQLCETLATEKDMIVAERDYLKQEIGMFIEQTQSLEKENAALSQEMTTKRELEEFKSLEEEFRKEHENELQNEISQLKKAVESSTLQCLELQNKLETVSEELKKKTEFAEELQSMSGKDLVQEVAKLRRSLDDAEGLSRDTKKEWAVLRSQNIATEEMNMTLNANYDKMEAEVKSLRSQLETEKSHFRKMQSDLQKELNVAFAENTKLTALLDGNVPKNLIDSIELERTAAQLTRELTASQEAEGALRAQLEELASLQPLPDKVENLTKQLNQLTEELQCVRAEKDALLSEKDAGAQSSAEEMEKLLSAVTSLTAERDQLMRDRQQNVEMAAETQVLVHSLQEELQEQRHKNSDLVKLCEQKESDLGEHMRSLSQDLQSVRVEKDTLLSEQNACAQSSAEEMEKLLSIRASLTAERDQLQMDMQENVEIMIENQEELRTAIEKNREQKERIKQLETAQTSKQDGPPNEMSAQIEELQTRMMENQEELRLSQEKIKQLQDEISVLTSQKAELEGRPSNGSDAEITLQNQIQRLTEELESVRAERDSLLSERTADTRSEEMEKLLCRVTSLGEERDQLQEIMEGLRQEKNQLKAELEDRMEMVVQAQSGFNHPEILTSELQPHDEKKTQLQQEMMENQEELRESQEKIRQLQDEISSLLSERTTDTPTRSEEMERLLCRVTSLSEDRDQLQEIMEGLRQEKNQLRAELEDRMETMQTEMMENQEELRVSQEKIRQLQDEISVLTSQEAELEGRPSNERDAEITLQLQELQNQIQRLTEELESVRAERDSLLSERTADTHSEEMEKLLCRVTSLGEERDQLQEIMEGLRQEKNQLRAELEDRMETMQTEMMENQEELRESQEKIRVLQDEISVLTSQKAELEDRQSNERDAEITLQLQELQNQIQRLTEELESVRAERDSLLSERTADTHSEEMEKLLCRVTSLGEERDQLQEIMEGLRQEKNQLRAELEDRMETMQTEMMENQEELRVSQEKIRQLQDEISVLTSQEAELEGRPSNERDAEITLQLQELQNQIQRLTEELESVRAERDSLLSERTADTHSEEMEKLLCRVTSLGEERDQLQEIMEGLRQEKNQLRAELEDRMETMQTEIAQLNMSLQSVTEQKSQLENYLQQNMNMASTTQELLTSVQEELCAQKQINSDLEKLCQEKECSLDQQMRTLTEKLESIEAERDSLLSEKEANCLTSTEKMEKLLCSVKSLSEERDQLQELLEGLRQEKNQLRAELEDRMGTMQTEMRTLTEKLESIEAERDILLSKEEANCQTFTKETEKLQYKVKYLREERDQLQELLEGQRREKNRLKAELEDRMEMISAIQEKLHEQEQQQPERGERETTLQQRVQQLEEQLEMLKERQSRAVVDADASQQLLSDANTTISALKEQLSSLDQSTSGVKETVSSRLQDSTEQLQESFRKLQHFIDTCSKSNFTDPVEIQSAVKHSFLTSLPEPTKKAYIALCQVRQQAAECGRNIRLHLQAQARGYRKQFEELVKKDLAVFEERRLQDVLLCRAQAPCYSVKDEDFQKLWDHRLTELLDKRQLYLKKMSSILEKLWANMATYPSELSADIRDGKRFKEQLQAVLTNEPISFSRMDSILSCELDHTSAVAHNRRLTLQGVIDEHNALQEELKLLEDQANSQLGEERSKSSTLLQALEGAPLKTELSLLKDNQQLLLQLRQTEEKVKALCVQTEQLEDARIKASNRVSNHKQATQLLQTELQDCRAEVEEKDQAIQTLRSKLRESEIHLKKNASPSAVELEKLRTKLFKMEVELSSASDKHKEEIQRMTTLLKEKEESLRKLKETLRRSQQQGEVSILQGEDLHARLTNPRGLGIKTSILQEKTKLEEEVKTLHMKIIELESLVSSQQAEITKWKGRAIRLKVKTKGEVDKPSSPCTPTKRALPMNSDPSSSLSSPAKFLVTPRRVLDSPRKPLDSPNVLESPKSKFFDAGGASDVLSRTRPKQFFDNTSLGTIPGVSADRKEDLWPKSPSGQDEMCKTQ